MSTLSSDPLQAATNVVEIKPRRPPLIRRNAQTSIPKYIDSMNSTRSDASSLSPLQKGMPDYFLDIRFLHRYQIRPDLDGRLYTDSVPLGKKTATAERREGFPTYDDGSTRDSKLEEILNRRAALVHDNLSRAREKWALFNNNAGTSEVQDLSQHVTLAQVYREYLFYLDETSHPPPRPTNNYAASSPAHPIHDSADYFPPVSIFENALEDSRHLKIPSISRPLNFSAGPSRTGRMDLKDDSFSTRPGEDILEDSKDIRTAIGLLALSSAAGVEIEKMDKVRLEA